MSRILIRNQTWKKIHAGHQGIQRCRIRARSSVWWLSLSAQVKDTVKQCTICARDFTNRSEPLIPSSLPEYSWQQVGSDLFMLNGANYILVVDYFSRFPEVVKLTSTTTSSIVNALKSIFSRHGVPQTVVSDNGPQYASHEFARFAREYDFSHKTSSPHFP